MRIGRQIVNKTVKDRNKYLRMRSKVDRYYGRQAYGHVGLATPLVSIYLATRAIQEHLTCSRPADIISIALAPAVQS